MSCVKTLPLLLGLSAFWLGASAWALPEDREQPIRVQADTAELDDRQGVAVYRGDVVITQGTMKITGDTVTITQDDNGDVEVFTSIGKPAYYEQKPAVDKEIVKAYGLTIQYFAANERIVLIDQAKVVQVDWQPNHEQGGGSHGVILCELEDKKRAALGLYVAFLLVFLV